MAVGFHSRAFHGHNDPTSSPTAKGGKEEMISAHDKNKPERMHKGMPKGSKTLRQKALANKGEGK